MLVMTRRTTVGTVVLPRCVSRHATLDPVFRAHCRFASLDRKAVRPRPTLHHNLPYKAFCCWRNGQTPPLLRSCGVFIKGLRRRGIRRRFAGAPDIWRHFLQKTPVKRTLENVAITITPSHRYTSWKKITTCRQPLRTSTETKFPSAAGAR